MSTIKLIKKLKKEANALASDFTALLGYVVSKNEFSNKALLELIGSLSDPNVGEDAKTVLLMYVNSGRKFYFDAECALVDHIVSGNEKSVDAAKEVLFKYIEEHNLWFKTLKKLACLLKGEKTTEIAKTILLIYVAIPQKSYDDASHSLNVNGLGDEKDVDRTVVALLSDSNRHIAENAKEILLKLVSNRGYLSGWAQDALIELLKKDQWVRSAAKEILLKYRWHLYFDCFFKLLKNKEAAEAAKEILLHRAKTEVLDYYDQARLLPLIANGDEGIAKVAQEIFLSYIHTIGDLDEDIKKKVYHWSYNKRISEVIQKLQANKADNEADDEE